MIFDMNATHTPFAYGAYSPSKLKHSSLIPSAEAVRAGATKVTLILAGFAAMGYLMALSFARMG